MDQRKETDYLKGYDQFMMMSKTELNDSINSHERSRICSVPFLRTQEITVRMLVVAISGCLMMKWLPLPAGNPSWLGVLLAIYFTQNAFGYAVMNAMGLFFGGLMGSFFAAAFTLSGLIGVHWMLPCIFVVFMAGIVTWTNYNSMISFFKIEALLFYFSLTSRRCQENLPSCIDCGN